MGTYEQAREQLAAAIESGTITARVTANEGVKRGPDGWQHHAYRFELDVKGETILSNASYSAGMAHDDEPTAVDIVGSVLADCASVAPYWPDYDEHGEQRDADIWLEWADDLGFLQSGADGARRGLSAFRESAARLDLIRERLGEEETERLMALAQDL